MNVEKFKEHLLNVLFQLEKNGDIVITTTTPHILVDEMVKSVDNDIHKLVSKLEFSAITNGMNSLLHNIKPDDIDFQTIIGITKNEYRDLLDKLVDRNIT